PVTSAIRPCLALILRKGLHASSHEFRLLSSVSSRRLCAPGARAENLAPLRLLLQLAPSPRSRFPTGSRHAKTAETMRVLVGLLTLVGACCSEDDSVHLGDLVDKSAAALDLAYSRH